MRALISIILGSMMVNLSVNAKTSDKTENQENAPDKIDLKNPPPQKMEDSYTGRYPKRKFKGYGKYPRTELPRSTPKEILQTED